MCGGSAAGSVLRAVATMPGAEAVRDPHLLAVDDVVVAVADARRSGSPARRSRSAARSSRRRRAPRRSPSRGRSRSPLLLACPLCSSIDEQMKCVLMMPETRHPAARDLLDREAVRGQVEAHPAVLLGDREAEDAELAEALRRSRRGTRSAASYSRRARDDLAVHEVAHREQRVLLLRRQAERARSRAPPSAPPPASASCRRRGRRASTCSAILRLASSIISPLNIDRAAALARRSRRGRPRGSRRRGRTASGSASRPRWRSSIWSGCSAHLPSSPSSRERRATSRIPSRSRIAAKARRSPAGRRRGRC